MTSCWTGSQSSLVVMAVSRQSVVEPRIPEEPTEEMELPQKPVVAMEVSVGSQLVGEGLREGVGMVAEVPEQVAVVILLAMATLVAVSFLPIVIPLVAMELVLATQLAMAILVLVATEVLVQVAAEVLVATVLAELVAATKPVVERREPLEEELVVRSVTEAGSVLELVERL